MILRKVKRVVRRGRSAESGVRMTREVKSPQKRELKYYTQ